MRKSLQSCKWFDFDCHAKTVLGLVWFSFDFHYQAKAVLGLSPKLRLCEISCLQLQHSFRVAMNKVSIIIQAYSDKPCSQHQQLHWQTFLLWWFWPVIISQAASSSIDSRWEKHCTIWLSFCKFSRREFFPHPPFSWDPIVSDKIWGQVEHSQLQKKDLL